MARKKKSQPSQGSSGSESDTFKLTPTLGVSNEDRSKPSRQGRQTKPTKPTKPQPPKRSVFPQPCYTEVTCPACDHVVFLAATRDGEDLWLERQRRLLVFAGPYTEHKYRDLETGQEVTVQLPRDGMTLWDEQSGDYVLGRPATDKERQSYKAKRTLDGEVAWTIGHEGHLAHCKRWDLWLSGAAAIRRASLNVSNRGDSYYEIGIPRAVQLARSEEGTS